VLFGPLGRHSGVERSRARKVTLTIGKIASAVSVSPDTLRYYEREGLLGPAAKSKSGYRLYDQDTVRRVRFIKQAQNCGFTLTEIRALLELRASDSVCCRDVRRVALEKKLQLEAKIKAMRAMSKALDRLISTCSNESDALERCPILTAFER
jgi:MerR family transcriptional regulator, Zn(II)-responsive regulator of zntA